VTTITDISTISAIQNAYNNQQWQAAYQLVFDAISTEAIIQDPSGATYDQVNPSVGVDPAVWIWIAGAKNVNGNHGAFASYIRDYTAEQYTLRTGQPIPDGLVQSTSNLIAQRFIADLFGALDGPTASPPLSIAGSFASLTLPTLDQVGGIDAAAAAAGIFNNTTASGAPNYSPWAGTLLFTRLNDPVFFRDWVLTIKSNSNKQEDGTYDLASIAKTTADLGGLGFLLNVAISGDLSTALQVDQIGASAVAAAKAAATAFFDQTYGLTGNAIDIGADIFSYGILPNSATYIVGTTGADNALASIDGPEFLNAGRGDDTILGSYDPSAFGSYAVIDGGDGTDTIDYSSLNVPTTVNIENVGQLGVRVAVQKNPDSVGDIDYVYEVEKFKFGAGADHVTVSADADLSTIRELDGGGNPDGTKDILDLSGYGAKLKLVN
jgi:hypothetical protein